MGLFKRNFDKPGPGVSKDAPRKKGFARLFEILSRDISSLIKVNLLYAAILLPAQILFMLAIPMLGSISMLVFVALGLLACIPLGGATTAMYYILIKMLRDEHSYFWHDFKKAFKENFRATMLPGMLFALVTFGQITGFISFFLQQQAASLVVISVYLFSVLLFSMTVPYFFSQAAHVVLNPLGLIKNSILLALSKPHISFIGALLQWGLIIAQFLFFPFSVPFLLFIGYSIPCLLNLMWIWPRVDQAFGIEKTLRERNAKEIDERLGDNNQQTFTDRHHTSDDR